MDTREVTQDEIEELCREHDFLGWSETSVKEGIMIEESMGLVLIYIRFTEMLDIIFQVVMFIYYF